MSGEKNWAKKKVNERFDPFSNLAFIFLGIIYITCPFIFLFGCGYAMDESVYHPLVILGYFFLLWANDTGAFVFGSLFGAYPLFKRVSPNKTWEGSAGGAFLVVVTVYFNYAFIDEFHCLVGL